MRNSGGCLRNNRGQALVELALILPVFLLMLLAMLEFGLVLHDYITVAEAARAGARAAAVHKTNDVVTAAAKSAAPSIPADKLQVSIVPEAASARTTDEPVTVQVVYPVPVSVSSITNPFTGEEYQILPATVNVTGTAVMRME